MRAIKKLMTFSIFFVSLSSYALNEIEEITPEQAFKIGRELRLQHHNKQALEYLKYAANSGHAMAALMYADELATLPYSIRRQGEIDYHTFRSAESGNIWAMERLATTNRSGSKETQTQWQENFYYSLKNEAESGNIKAVLSMFYLNRDDNYKRAKIWLNMALEQDSKRAKLAEIELLEHGYEKWYVFSRNRQNESTKRYAKLANTGYLPAVKKMIQLLVESGETHKAVVWLEEAVKKGDATSLVLMAKAYAGYLPKARLDKDLVRSYSYYLTYLETMGSDKLAGTRKRIEEEEQAVRSQLKESQIAEAEKLHEEYMKNHTVMMYEPPWKYELN